MATRSARTPVAPLIIDPEIEVEQPLGGGVGVGNTALEVVVNVGPAMAALVLRVTEVSGGVQCGEQAR